MPLTLPQANELVATLHRHHKPVVGHRFSIGVVDSDRGGAPIGAAIVGRPVAGNRMSGNQYEVAEVTRLVTDGTKNACSFLYSAAARIAREMGFKKIQTYILDSESGVSVRAAGWQFEAHTQGCEWNAVVQLRLDAYAEGKITGNRIDQPTWPKQRWAKVFV